jgi:hypothetical protein
MTGVIQQRQSRRARVELNDAQAGIRSRRQPIVVTQSQPNEVANQSLEGSPMAHDENGLSGVGHAQGLKFLHRASLESRQRFSASARDIPSLGESCQFVWIAVLNLGMGKSRPAS